MDRSRLSRFLDQPLSELPLEEPVLVSIDDALDQALSQMREGARSCVLAMEDGELAGIFTERDVLTKCMDGDFDWRQPVGTVITRKPHTLSAGSRIADAVAMLQQHSYRTIPVVDNGRVLGLMRLGDLLRHLAEAFPEDVLNLPPRPHQVMDKQEGG